MINSDDNAELQLAPDVADGSSSELVHNLLRLVQIAQYRRKTIMQCVCVATLVGAAYYALAPRYYDASAKLLVIQRNHDEVASVGEQPGLDNTMATHRELVVSPVVVQDAIEHLQAEHRVDFEDAPPSAWARNVARCLSARTTRKTNIIELSYRSLSPEAAAAVVSAVIQSYLQFVETTHKGSAGDIIAVLTHEREQLTQNLAAKQRELQAFRQRAGHLAIESGDGAVDPTIQRALKLNDALMEAQQQRLKLQASLAAITVAIDRGDDVQQYIVGLEQVVGQQMLASALGLSAQDMELMKGQEQELLAAQAELQKIAPFYGPAHPKAAELNERVRTIEHYLANYRTRASERMATFGGGELGAVLKNLVTQSVAQALQEEQQLQVSFAEARAAAARQSGDLVQLQMLEREVSRLESLHDVLFDRIANVDIRQLQAPIQATVVQEPLPDEMPDSPQLRMVAMAALFGGLIVGGLIAYVQDVLDDRFASPEEMSTQLGVRMLAMIRRLDALDGKGLASVHTYVAPSSVEAEAFRTLRTAITLGAGATDRIAISSAEPSDGKTTVAVNLAVSFAQAGKKTLLIDADLRKPGLTILLGLRGQPGVADVLYGQDEVAFAAAEWVRHTELRGLDVLPAGLRRPNPAELLSGPNFVELLAWAEANYDQVLVDCPPVLAVSDAQIVGRLVDGAILVVQPHKNHRRLVVRACHSFAATGTNVLGVVANGLSSESGHGYGYGYGYSYDYGYGDDNDANAAEGVAAADDESVPSDASEDADVISVEKWNAAAASRGKAASERAA